MILPKCQKCGAAAHKLVDGVLYCKDCCICGCGEIEYQPTEAASKVDDRSWWDKLKDAFIKEYAENAFHL